MKGYPSVVATGEDLRHCLALVGNGQLAPDDLRKSIGSIENREHIYIPICKTSEDGRHVVVGYCGEVKTGVSVNKGENKVLDAQPMTIGDQQTEDPGQPTHLEVTLQKPVDASDEFLLVLNPTDPYKEMGTTKEELKAIKEVLKNYE